MTNIQTKNNLFDTAHEILSNEVSSLNPSYSSNHQIKNVSGEELTNLLYGSKENEKKLLKSKD